MLARHRPGDELRDARPVSRGSGRRVIQAFSASAAAAAASLSGTSSRSAIRHSSSRCGFSGGASRRAARSPSTRWGHRRLSGRLPAASTARASRSASATGRQQPQPGPHAPLPRAADRDVALLAEPQGIDQHGVGLGQPSLLDVQMSEVAHRCRRELVDPLLRPMRPAAISCSRPCTSPPTSREIADADRGCAIQGRVVQLVGDPLCAGPASDRFGRVVALRRQERAVRECVAQLTSSRHRQESRATPRPAAARQRDRPRTSGSTRSPGAPRRPRRRRPAPGAARAPASAPRSRRAAGR